MGERGPRDEATREVHQRRPPEEAARRGRQAPEKVVVDDPPPKPGYPRYRAEPGERLSLSDVNPGESEH